MEVPNDFLNRGLSQILKISHGYLVLPIIGSTIIKEKVFLTPFAITASL